MAKKKNPEHDKAHTIFESIDSKGAGHIALAELPRVLEALGQSKDLENALGVIEHVKKFSFDSPAADRLSWGELKAWLDSDKPTT